MFDLTGLEFGAAATAMTGAVIGWALRPLFLRYRRAFVVAAAALATVGAAAYEMFDQEPAVEARVATRAAPPPPAPRAAVIDTPTAMKPESGFLPDYLEKAGNAAFDERDYATAIRYWRDASMQLSSTSPRQAQLATAIARAMRMLSDAS